jgi:transposase-like protein
VEVDESFWGSEEEGMRGRQTESKVLLAIAAQEDGKGIGRIRMRRIPDASAQSLMPFVEEAIEPGSLVHTDGWSGYDPLEGKGYRHRITFLKGRKESASDVGLAAAGSSGSLAVEAVAVGHPPRCGQPGAPRLLPG